MPNYRQSLSYIEDMRRMLDREEAAMLVIPKPKKKTEEKVFTSSPFTKTCDRIKAANNRYRSVK